MIMFNTRILAAVALVSVFVACTPALPPGSSISSAQVLELTQSEQPPLILDVRSPEEFADGHVPGALNIPHTQISARIDEVQASKDDLVIVYCERGGRARTAETALQQAGFSNVKDMDGHMSGWRAQGHPTEK